MHDFTQAMKELKRVWEEFLRATGKTVLHDAVLAFKGLGNILKAFEPATNVAGRAVGTLVKMFDRFTKSPLFKEFLKMLVQFGPAFIKAFGKTGFNLMKAMLELFIAFAPLAKIMLNGLAGLTGEFAKWMAGFVKGKAFQDFIHTMVTQGPLLMQLLVDLVVIFVKLLIAMGPAVTLLLEAITPLINLYASLPPGVVLAIAGALLLLAGGFLAVVGVIALVIAAITLLVQDYGPQIAAFFTRIGKDIAGWVTDAVKKLGDFEKWIWGAFQTIHKDVTNAWNGMWTDVENAVIDTGKAIWNHIITWGDDIWGAFKDIGDNLSSSWEWTWNHIVGFVRTSVNDVIGIVNDLIGAVDWARTPRLGLGNLIPKIPQWNVGASTGSSGGPIPVGTGMGGFGVKEGGVLPGFTPGRDVHRFVSATGGVLDLSGGEGIMRPEFVRAVGGAAGIAALNASARGYADGGVVARPGAVDTKHYPFRGVFLDSMTIAGILRAEKMLHQVFHLVQGSWSTSVAASGSTHAGGGAFDASSPWTPAAVAALRVEGPFAAWQRNPSQGPWEDHIHAVLMGDPLLSSAAYSQVQQFMAGGNGLGGPDDGPHVGPAYGGKSGGGILSGIGGFLSGAYGLVKGVASLLTDPMGYLRGKLHGFVSSAGSKLDSPFGKMLLTMPWKLLSMVGSKIGGFVGGLFGSGGTAISTNVAAAQRYARAALPGYGWAPDQMTPLVDLWNRESGWAWNAKNPSSGAYGIPQSLPASKMASAGADYLTNPATQIKWGLGYIKGRYGSPSGAWAHELSSGWYDAGGVASGAGYLPKQVIAPERVLGPSSTRALDEGLRNLGRSPESMRIEGVLSIDERGRAYISGLARTEVRNNDAYTATLARMR